MFSKNRPLFWHIYKNGNTARIGHMPIKRVGRISGLSVFKKLLTGVATSAKGWHVAKSLSTVFLRNAAMFPLIFVTNTSIASGRDFLRTVLLGLSSF